MWAELCARVGMVAPIVVFEQFDVNSNIEYHIFSQNIKKEK